MGRIEPAQGNLHVVNGHGRTSCCFTCRTRQAKALDVVEGSLLLQHPIPERDS